MSEIRKASEAIEQLALAFGGLWNRSAVWSLWQQYDRASEAWRPEEVRGAFAVAMDESASFRGVCRLSYHAVAIDVAYFIMHSSLCAIEPTLDPTWHKTPWRDQLAFVQQIARNPTKRQRQRADEQLPDVIRRWEASDDRDMQWFLSRLGKEAAKAEAAATPVRSVPVQARISPADFYKPECISGVGASWLRDKAHDGDAYESERVRRIRRGGSEKSPRYAYYLPDILRLNPTATAKR